MQRVMIIGGPGAGKSWLASKLGLCLDLPVIAIDDLVRRGDGGRRGDAEIDADAIAAASGKRWIIEGGNTRTYHQRLARADYLIRLKPSRLTRLWRVLWRRGVTPALLHWTWSYDAAFGPKDNAILLAAADRGIACHDLRSPAEVRRFLASLPLPIRHDPFAHQQGPKRL